MGCRPLEVLERGRQLELKTKKKKKKDKKKRTCMWVVKSWLAGVGWGGWGRVVWVGWGWWGGVGCTVTILSLFHACHSRVITRFPLLVPFLCSLCLKPPPSSSPKFVERSALLNTDGGPCRLLV